MTTTHRNRPQVDEMRAALEASTQGEWVWGKVHQLSRIVVFEEGNNLVLKEVIADIESNDQDAKAITFIHNTMPSLLDYIAYLEGLCGRAESDLVATAYMDADKYLIDELKAAASVPTPDAAGEGGE